MKAIFLIFFLITTGYTETYNKMKCMVCQEYTDYSIVISRKWRDKTTHSMTVPLCKKHSMEAYNKFCE
jgi:hypothetical protein